MSSAGGSTAFRSASASTRCSSRSRSATRFSHRAGVVRAARQRLAQQRLGRFVTAGEARERREIGCRRGMAGRGPQGAGHGHLRVLDRPLRVAREAKVDPGVGKARPQRGGDGEGLFGPRRLAGGHPGLAIGVMRLGAIRLGKAGVARGLSGRLRLPAPQGVAEIAQSRS